MGRKNMQKNSVQKIFVIGIIFLLIVGIILPNISGDEQRPNKNLIVNLNEINNAPEEDWNITYSIEGWGNCVQETPDDCYIIAGTCGFGYWWDAFLLKADNQGNELWNRTFGTFLPRASYEFGQWVEVTNDGGYILVGCKDRSSYPNSNMDIWLVKTDSNGNEEWNRTFFGEKNNVGFCVKQTEDGGYVITGEYNSRMCLFKTNENGIEEWNYTYHSGEGYSVEQTEDGGYIITGNNGPHSNALVVKTDENGNKSWITQLPNQQRYYSSGRRIQQTIDGEYIIGGFTSAYGAGSHDYWIIKLDSNGNKKWDQTYGGPNYDEGFSAIQTVDGGYIIGGMLDINDGDEKFWLIRTDGNGEVIWEKRFIPKLSARCLCLQQTKDDGYIATGLEDWTNNNGCVLVKIGPDIQNHPPSSPTISGPKNGKVGRKYQYTFDCFDQDDDDVSYFVNWGDGSHIEMIFPTGPTGTEAKATHIWDEKGAYGITAQTRDSFGTVSPWSDPYPVSMPRLFTFRNYIFIRIIRILNDILN
jgi:hypothetical protein